MSLHYRGLCSSRMSAVCVGFYFLVVGGQGRRTRARAVHHPYPDKVEELGWMACRSSLVSWRMGWETKLLGHEKGIVAEAERRGRPMASVT